MTSKRVMTKNEVSILGSKLAILGVRLASSNQIFSICPCYTVKCNAISSLKLNFVHCVQGAYEVKVLECDNYNTDHSVQLLNVLVLAKTKTQKCANKIKLINRNHTAASDARKRRN